MRIKLFETFESPSFQEISHEEFNEKLDSRSRESWTELEIEKITRLFQEELGWENCIIRSANAAFPASYLLIEISNRPPISKWRWKLLNLYIVKQEDEWFLIIGHSLPFECDQFSGLVECIKQLFTK